MDRRRLPGPGSDLSRTSWLGWAAAGWLWLLPCAASAQDVDEQSITPSSSPNPEPAKDKKPSLREQMVDEADGKFDISSLLARGGFFPMPVIITEPAVGGGFGLVAQFVHVDPQRPLNVTRRMAGGAKTGNGSYGFGYFQSGQALGGKLRYKTGIGTGKLTIRSFPRFLPSGLEYTNHYDFAAIGSVQIALGDGRVSIGPLLDMRRLRTTVDIEGLPDYLPFDFNRTVFLSALGVGVHYDNRDNKLTPTNGLNLYAVAKFNSSVFGSDRNFQVYQVNGYAFRQLAPAWRLGLKAETSAVRGRYPIYFARSVDLRGVEARRFQGASVINVEFELTRQLDPRWSILAFGGVGATDAGSSRLFSNSGPVFAGGGGIRYRIARKLGLDTGLDLAVGPGGFVFYLQFGHAWGFGMD